MTTLKGIEDFRDHCLILFGCIFNYNLQFGLLHFRRGSVLLFIKYICLIKDLLTLPIKHSGVFHQNLRFTFSHFQVKIKQILHGRGNQINSIKPRHSLASRFSRVFFDVNAEKLIEIIFCRSCLSSGVSISS